MSRSRCYRPPRSIAAPSSLRTSSGPSNRKSNRSSARTTVPRRCNRGWRGSAAERPADTIDPNGRVRRRDSEAVCLKYAPNATASGGDARAGAPVSRQPPSPALLGNRSQPTATVLAFFWGFRADPLCGRLPPVATTGLDKGFILRLQARRPTEPRRRAGPGRGRACSRRRRC